MPEPNLFQIFTSRFNQADINYMVTGSVAAIIYGQPRLTHDVDLVVDLHRDQVQKLLDQFPQDTFYCPPEEVIRIEIARETRGHFNLIHHDTAFKADIYPISSERLHRWAIANRRKVVVAEDSLWLAPPEYVIVRKLQYYREGTSPKHLIDIQNMFEFSPDLVHSEYLLGFIEEYDLHNEFSQAKNKPGRADGHIRQ